MLINVNNINSSFELLRWSNPSCDLERTGRQKAQCSLPGLYRESACTCKHISLATSSKQPCQLDVCIPGSKQILHWVFRGTDHSLPLIFQQSQLLWAHKSCTEKWLLPWMWCQSTMMQPTGSHSLHHREWGYPGLLLKTGHLHQLCTPLVLSHWASWKEYV